MVSRKRRRRQLARAAAERQALRRASRGRRRRRIQRIVAIALFVVALVALAAWISTHKGSQQASSAAIGYHPTSRSHLAERGTTTSHEVAR